MIRKTLPVLFAIIIAGCMFQSIAQTVTRKALPSDTIKAQYPGGINAWRRYLERNLNGTILETNAVPTGNYVIRVELKLDTTGYIVSAKAQNDPGYGLSQEAVRVVGKSKWIPATVNGKPIDYSFVQTITFVGDTTTYAANARTRNLSYLTKKQRDSIFKARDILSIKEQTGTTDAIADSILAIKKIFTEKMIPSFYEDTVSLNDEKYVNICIITLEKNQSIQKILTEAQYKKWINIKGHYAGEPINNSFLQYTTTNNLAKTQLKTYKDSLHLTSVQTDSLISIYNRFSINANKIKLDTSSIKKEQLEQLSFILRQKNERIKANLTPAQFKKWQQLEMDYRKKMPVKQNHDNSSS